jgi:lysophospholipase L1-like esterase
MEDFWLFLGDSNTSVVFDGALAGTTRFGAGINQRIPARWPIALNGGVDGGVMDHYLRTRADPWSDAAHDGTGAILYPDTQGNPQPLVRRWMQQFPGKYVSIAIGTNDINQISWHAATTAELDVMQAKMERIINEALAAGKTVILPTLRWCTTNAYTAANMAAWNARVWNVILPKYPTVLRGPDVYAASVDHPEWLADSTHPNALGAATSMTTWVDWAVANVYTPR